MKTKLALNPKQQAKYKSIRAVFGLTDATNYKRRTLRELRKKIKTRRADPKLQAPRVAAACAAVDAKVAEATKFWKARDAEGMPKRVYIPAGARSAVAASSLAEGVKFDADAFWKARGAEGMPKAAEGVRDSRGFIAPGGRTSERINTPPSENAAPDVEKVPTGVKFDAEKIRMDLLSEVAVEGLAKVLTFGAKKYSADNWRNGMEWRRVIGAAMRHLFAFSRGENTDRESKLPHIDHLLCCAMFLSEYQKRATGTDDRFKTSDSPALAKWKRDIRKGKK